VHLHVSHPLLLQATAAIALCSFPALLPESQNTGFNPMLNASSAKVTRVPLPYRVRTKLNADNTTECPHELQSESARLVSMYIANAAEHDNVMGKD
jgi:hypothetical protein